MFREVPLIVQKEFTSLCLPWLSKKCSQYLGISSLQSVFLYCAYQGNRTEVLPVTGPMLTPVPSDEIRNFQTHLNYFAVNLNIQRILALASTEPFANRFTLQD